MNYNWRNHPITIDYIPKTIDWLWIGEKWGL